MNSKQKRKRQRQIRREKNKKRRGEMGKKENELGKGENKSTSAKKEKKRWLMTISNKTPTIKMQEIESQKNNAESQKNNNDKTSTSVKNIILSKTDIIEVLDEILLSIIAIGICLPFRYIISKILHGYFIFDNYIQIFFVCVAIVIVLGMLGTRLKILNIKTVFSGNRSTLCIGILSTFIYILLCENVSFCDFVYKCSLGKICFCKYIENCYIFDICLCNYVFVVCIFVLYFLVRIIVKLIKNFIEHIQKKMN